MKISKNELKELIKECIIEVLADGLGRDLHEVVSHKRHRPQRQKPQAPQRKQTHVPSDALLDAVKAEAGGDPIMESILSDTAKTTLPRMLGSEDVRGNPVSVPATLEDEVVANSTPDELFGEDNMSRWASTAFAGQKTQGD